MHVCEEFRERVTEQILDRTDLDQSVEVQRELLVCNSCADFYSESRDLIEAMSGVRFEIEESQWDGMADRLRTRILADYAERTRPSWFARLGLVWNVRPYVPAMAGALAMMLVAFGVYRMAVPIITETEKSMGQVQQTSATVVLGAPNAGLDPLTVEFLEQSELLLRTVMKLQPSHIDDLEETRLKASKQLMGLRQRKEAAAEMPRAVVVMDKYEMILRELRNLDERPAADDIKDIKNRIEKNGLIASMKAFQPKVSTVDTEFDKDR